MSVSGCLAGFLHARTSSREETKAHLARVSALNALSWYRFMKLLKPQYFKLAQGCQELPSAYKYPLNRSLRATRESDQFFCQK